MPNYRDGSPAQLSLLRQPNHYATSNMSLPKLGIILEVRNADNPKNRSSIEVDDRRGWAPEATVWLVQDAAILEHVLILPPSPSGLDDFDEQLPRASQKTVKGLPFDSNISEVDPYDLDGDWCIISFLDGNIQNPYVSNWYPSPRNSFDYATSGKGNPTASTNRGTALKQTGRIFKRINGVEYVITKEGDIWLSTYRAGSKINPGGISKDGRFPRTSFSGGGSILVNVKPTKSLEITFDEQVDGIGPGAVPNDYLPQPNPSYGSPRPLPITNSYIEATKDKINIAVPVSFTVRSKGGALIEAPTIKLGENAVDKVALTIPTMANFNALVATVNSIMAAMKVPSNVISNSIPPVPLGATIPNAASIALTPLPAPTSVAAVKVYGE